MLALYKQKGVNPASGCMPMLLTFPILLAFYNLLSSAIELRGAPFVGWIHDLSAKDPTYIWPVLMGGTMFWQQKMMPTHRGPDAAEDLPADAGHVHRDVPEHAERSRDLLADEQPADDRPAVPDEPHHGRSGAAGQAKRQASYDSITRDQRLGRPRHRVHHQRHVRHGAHASGRRGRNARSSPRQPDRRGRGRAAPRARARRSTRCR